MISTVLFTLLAAHAQAFDHKHTGWNTTLSQSLDASGRVRYATLKKELTPSHPFTVYVQSVQQVSEVEYQKWTPAEQKAFLINAYNALTVKLIVDNYPVKSIKKIGGLFTKPWSVKFFRLFGGKIQSLDPIEHEWLRPKFKDYRIHAAVNCASESCPPLRRSAFTADQLDAQLDEQMKAWLSDPTRNDLSGATLKLSKIFDWYKKDFEQWGGGVLKVVSKYATIHGKDYKFLDYNWDLNEAK